MKNVVALLSALTVLLSTAAPLTAAEPPQSTDPTETAQGETTPAPAP